MRIFIITSEFPPSFGGGISMYVEQIATAYSQAHHNVTVITRSDQDSITEEINNNYRVVRFKHCARPVYGQMGYWPALSFDVADQLKALIELDGVLPDVVEVQDYNALGYYILQRRLAGEAPFRDLKVVIHAHTPTFKLLEINKVDSKKFPDYWVGELEKFCLMAADGVVTQSQFLAGDLRPYCKKDIQVIPLPYSVSENDTSMSFDENVGVLYVGRFEYRKGVLQMLKEFKNLWDSGSSVRLTMIGGDTYFAVKKIWLRAECKKIYAKYIENDLLHILDPIAPESLCLLIKKSKLVVIPSLYENYPYACLMSMACSRPVLVSAAGGQAEMVGDDESVGLVFDWAIPGSFKSQLNRFLEFSKDRLEKMGENAFEKIREISLPQRNVASRLEFFESLAGVNSNEFPIPEYVRRMRADGRPASFSVSSNSDPVPGRISVLIPYYNLGDYIRETIASALASDYGNIEIIIINDGSTDKNSIEVLDSIRIDYPFIRVIDIDNAGLANARNVGAQVATGEFLTFLDADDLVCKEFYSKAIGILSAHGEISFVYSWLEYFEGASGVWVTYNTHLPFMACANMLSAFCVVRRTDFINFGLNDVSMEYGMEDYESWLRMVGNGCIGFSIPEVLVKYRVRKDSMSRQFNRTMLRYLYEKLAEKNKNIYSQYGDEIFQLLVANGPGYFWNNPTFESPELQHVYEHKEATNANEAFGYQRAELLRIAESKLGRFLISLLFKFKINKFFKR